MFTVPDVRSNECPVSCVTRQTHELIQIYHRAKSLQDAGVSSFSAKDMPIPLADAFVVIGGEEAKYESVARDYAEYDTKYTNAHDQGRKQ